MSTQQEKDRLLYKYQCSMIDACKINGVFRFDMMSLEELHRLKELIYNCTLLRKGFTARYFDNKYDLAHCHTLAELYLLDWRVTKAIEQTQN